MKDPTKQRDYLTDANYYRLGYQLAAQLLNRKLAQSRDTRSDNRARYERRAELPDPLDVAVRVLADTRLMLAWYCDRSSRPKRRPRAHKVEPHEQRLMTFLADTVEPCTHLVAAAALRERGKSGDRELARQHVDAVLRHVRDNKVSYRVYYSLACWQVSLAEPSDEEARLERALDYLDTSLSMAPRNNGIALAEWAQKDPSLTGLSGGLLKESFDELVRRFERPQESLPQADALQSVGNA